MSIALAVLLSAAMWFWSSGVHHVWPLAWLAPVPLLIVLPGMRLRWAVLAACLAPLLAALNLVFAYPTLPGPVLVSILLGIAIQSAIVLLAWRMIARRLGAVRSVLAYASLQAAMEFAVSQTSPHGTFGSLGYSQADVLPVIQLASVAGVIGVSFLVALLSAALAVAWSRRAQGRARNLALATGIIPLLATLAFGLIRLQAPAAPRTLTVGLLANDTRLGLFGTTDSAWALGLIRGYGARAGELAVRGAAVVVLPEKFVGVADGYDATARQALADIARQHHVTLVAGINRLANREPRNLALVYGPDGRQLVEYDKRHPVPGLEDGYRLGIAPALLQDSAGTLGVAICKDMDFVPLGREYAKAGAGLLLVPAWDFTTDRWIHSRMAVVRGIEGGFAVARSAAQGLLTLSDAYGRIVAEAPSADSLASVLGSLPVASAGTFFGRRGEWFAWGCVVASGLLVVLALARGRRPGVGRQEEPA